MVKALVGDVRVAFTHLWPSQPDKNVAILSQIHHLALTLRPAIAVRVRCPYSRVARRRAAARPEVVVNKLYRRRLERFVPPH